MQDLSDGSMRDLTPFLKDIPPADQFTEALKDEIRRKELEAQLQQAKDAVQPDRDMQGPVFMLGEVLEIRGGRFQLTKIEPGHLRLKSLPALPAASKPAPPEGGRDAYTRDRMQKIARLIDEELPQGWGFFVMAFPFNNAEGRMNYVSNAKREDIAKVMRQFLTTGGFKPEHT